MKNRILKTFLIGLAISAAAQSVYAAEVKNCTLEKNYSTGALNIAGESEKNERITIQIINNEKTLSDITTGENSGVLYYSNEVKTNEDGKFEIDAKLNATGDFTVYLADSTTGSIKSFPLEFVKYTDYETAVNALNAASEADYESVLAANLFNLGFEDNQNADMNKLATLLYKETRTVPITVADYKTNTVLYNKCLAVNLLNSSKADNIAKYITDYLDKDSVLKGYYDKHITSEAREKYLTGVMKAKNITDTSDLKTKLVEGVILTAVKYPDGYANIQKIFDEYKSYLSLTSVSSSNSVYSSLAGSDFSTISALVSRYNELVSGGGKGNGGGGGGGNSSTGSTGKSTGTSGGGISIDFNGTSNPSISNSEKNTIGMKFEDLNSVPWAYTAIAKLYDEKIINGDSETTFLPEHQVTREAMVKMIISAMGLNEASYGNNEFSDVESGAWYEKYVLIAKENRLINGIGNNVFGIGNNVSRQDMAVMIYNAMLKKGYQPKGTELAFADSDSIADYAKAAVAELFGAGIITGVGDNNFDPNGEATRAQAAVIIFRALEYLK